MSHRIGLALVPQNGANQSSSTVQGGLSPSQQLLVEAAAAPPLAYVSASDGAWNQPNDSDAGIPLEDGVGEGHPGAHAAGLGDVDVAVERLPRLLPRELGVEAEDQRVGVALRRHEAVPGGIDDTSTAGHVALAGEDEYVFRLGGDDEIGVGEKQGTEEGKHGLGQRQMQQNIRIYLY